MSNLPPDWNASAEPREHDNRCNSLCAWNNEQGNRIIDKIGECPEWTGRHISHECNCAELHTDDLADFYENQAEAYADRGWDRE